MNATELGLTLTLAAVLVGLALYFGRRQLQTLRILATGNVGSADERTYLRSQAYRRLLCSALMLVFAAFLLGWLFLDPEYSAIQAQVRQTQANDPAAPLTEEQKQFVRWFSTYWIVALVVLLVLVTLAAFDFWATARFGLAQHRRLQADHRALLQQPTGQRRRDRNGSS